MHKSFNVCSRETSANFNLFQFASTTLEILFAIGFPKAALTFWKICIRHSKVSCQCMMESELFKRRFFHVRIELERSGDFTGRSLNFAAISRISSASSISTNCWNWINFLMWQSWRNSGKRDQDVSANARRLSFRTSHPHVQRA